MTIDSVFQSAAFEDAIRNPANPAHLMVIKPVTRRIRIFAGDVLLADTKNALRVLEVGRSVYDPVIYVPEADLMCDFDSLEKSTHCPIKGDATYITLEGEELGWVYTSPIETSQKLANHYAFWPNKVRLIEGT
ncbi:DUF427 domain-containing protein [Roseibium sp.]|uniref:DUF427 domain-containing protein n=1 Tax=Roseibium sp. TaxID=1936156 RepID=UPI003B51BB66